MRRSLLVLTLLCLSAIALAPAFLARERRAGPAAVRRTLPAQTRSSTGTVPLPPAAPVPALATVATPASARQPGVAAAARPEDASAFAYFSNPAVPLDDRIKAIRALGIANDEQAKTTLMALGNAPIYLNRYAVEAIGARQGADVKQYLEGKLNDPEAVIVCAAAGALVRSAGKDALADLAAALAQNRRRDDGHQQMVCTAIVHALREIADADAAPVLLAELARNGERGWSLEYGSEIVAALRRVATPEVRAAALQYADALEQRVPDDPLAGPYVKGKIAEARAP